MIEVTVTVDVDRPADEVFAFWSDWSNNPTWQSGMTSCTWTSEPPLQLGSTYDQQATMLGRPIVSSFEVVEYEPDRMVRIRTTQSTLPLDITRRVEPLPDGGTRLHATIRGEPQGLQRLLNPVMQRLVDRNVRRDYARLRDLLNAGSA
ncbi:SRPBCC family protein [Euzebya tangerina]|uniref:SRPBCC family protein n=1 Tax=Euzebya tangerina TaxID=591198 RepID=UPI000E31ABA7|nr:SRPBCC family protein [Euzebya tangerina]